MDKIISITILIFEKHFIPFILLMKFEVLYKCSGDFIK